jgi:BirA family transcriptional regulator, biotin operon repressor / biotin---[acetyl-CoA-carboxylase] ligase
MPSRIGRRHLHLAETDSTNTRAAELAADPASDGTVITADVQTRGRGQYGRTWQSPPGANVLLSTLLFPPPELRRPAILTAFAAVVVAETVSQTTGETATIKWPNDVLVRGKKVCGILSEAGVRSAESGPHFIVGIGLNVNLSADDFTRMELPDATSLSIVGGRPLDVPAVTRSLIDNLDAEYGRLLAGGLDGLEARWAAAVGRLGEPVTVERMDGSMIHGRLVALTFDEVVVGKTRLMPEEVRHVW